MISGGSGLRESLAAGMSAGQIAAGWDEQAGRFLESRAGWLLYG
jgi:hypothetical protein